MPTISGKQKMILAYIEEFSLVHGYAPSVREIGAKVGLRSTSTVQAHLNNLQKAGYLAPAAHKPRTLSSKRGPVMVPRVPILENTLESIMLMKCEGYVPFMPAAQGGTYFATKAKDNAMNGVGILEGDLLIVRRDVQAQDGNIVLVQGNTAFACRMIRITPTETWLMSSNSDTPPVRGEDHKVIGVVQAVQREYTICAPNPPSNEKEDSVGTF